MFDGSHILVEEVDGTQNVLYVNENFLNNFKDHIHIDFDDKLIEEYKVPNIC